MMNQIAPYQAINVSNRNIVEAVRAVPSVELNPYFSRNQNSKSKTSYSGTNHRPSYNTQAFNPYFAVHVLIEAGEIDEKDANRGFAAYNKTAQRTQNTLIIA